MRYGSALFLLVVSFLLAAFLALTLLNLMAPAIQGLQGSP